MPDPYYADEFVALYLGDALDVVSRLPNRSVDCVVTSPPYYRLRDYGELGQYGLERHVVQYVERLRALFDETRMVLADDGTLWLNIGDAYSDNKSLLGIPWLVAFALQTDGWILRNAIVWNKSNAMPESAVDRLANRYELLFLFSKKRAYWFDLDPIRQPHMAQRRSGSSVRTESYREATGDVMRGFGPDHSYHPAGRNPGDIWEIATTPFPEAHFATFPVELPRRCILAGCKPGGTVLDPFSGTGTTGLAAGQLGRRYIGIDLSKKYLDMSLRTRLAQTALVDGEVPA